MGFGKFVFYNTDELRMNDKIAMFRDCKELSYKWWADKLDCSHSMSRQRVDCPFETILGRLKENTHVVVIDRGEWGDFDDKKHFEIGFRTMESPIDHFLFIEVESENMPPVLSKYNLNVRS
jgi:hypothetical protein